MLDGGPPAGSVVKCFQSFGKERNVPIQALRGCPGHTGGALELLERVAM